MEKKKSKGFGMKLIVCLTVLLMFGSYFPIISTIVEAAVTDTNQVNNTTKQSEPENQIVSNTVETKESKKTSEEPKEEAKETSGQSKTETTETTKTVDTTLEQNKTKTVETKSTDKVIDIKDSKLKEDLLNAYDANGDKNLTESELLQITEFTCEYDVKDLSGLEYAKNIQTLYMYNSQYENMNAVYDLPKLKSLSLNSDNIKQLANFKSTNQLETLHLNNYNNDNEDIIDYNYIAGLTSLKTLEIGDNISKNVFNISTFSKLTNLEILKLNLNNQIKNINNIGSLENLIELDLSNSNIEDIRPLQELKKLQTLRIKATDSKENMDVLKALNVPNLYYYQDIENVYIPKGQKTEIEIPSVILKMIDKNSPIYVDEINFSSNLVSFNSDKTKLILDGTKAELGTNYSYVSGYHAGRNISVTLKCKVHEAVEKKEEVNIPDTELKRYLLKRYDADGDKKITNYDLLQITDFHIENDYNVKNLTGLERAQNITRLSLSNSEYEGLSAVNQLKKLTDLSLSNKVKNVMSKLTIMNNLTSLSLYNYDDKQELDYAYLGTLKNLKYLTTYDSNRKTNININDLKNLSNLQSLNITTNVKIDNLASLQQLKGLTSLSLHTGDKIDDIGFISKMTGLTSLDLSDNMISNIKPLKNLTKLNWINLMKNPINTKESETAQVLKTLRDNGTSIDVLETNKTSNIEFKDQKFKEILIKNNGADLNKDNQISIEEMERLTYLYISTSSSEETPSLAEITYATNLNYLQIYSKIEDLTPITKLTKLKTLHVSRDTLTSNNLKVIASLTNLEDLSINVSENIDNLEMFSNMKKLKALSISNYRYVDNKEKVFDLKGIEKLTNLNKVVVYGSVSNIDLLKKLSKLQTFETSEKLYKENGEQLTEKEVVEFLKSLKVKNIKFSGNTSKQLKLGNMVVGSNQKLDLANIDNELIKLVFTPGSMFYSENIRVSYYANNTDKVEHPITLDTKEMGEKYLSVNIKTDNFSYNLSVSWNNYIKADTTKEINIPDANLKKVLLENNDIDNDKRITEQDMINMQWLHGYSSKISSLEGLQHAKNLRYLGLNSNYIKDITPIIGIETLESVELSNNLLTDISLLKNAKWTNLNYIDLNNNFIDFRKNNANYNVLKNKMESMQNSYNNWKDEFEKTINMQYDNVGEIDNEVKLEDNLKARLMRLGIDTNQDGKITRRELYYAEIVNDYRQGEYEYKFNLSNANITNISGLEYLGVGNIDLSDNNIEDITPLTKNKSVYGLDLSNNRISNISGIENNYSLVDIDLSNNKISNISPITNLFNMKNESEWRYVSINLANNEISNIDCVKNWKNLRSLDLSGNKITNIKELRNYNFKLSDQMDENAVKEMAKYLTIDLSGNNINMTKAENKKAKEIFDNIGATLKLVDKTKTTEYILDKDGHYSSDSNLGLVSTELSSEGEYEFVPETDRAYYPDGSDTKLAGIFVHTKYYDADQERKEEIKAGGFDTEILVTGAVKTENELDGTQYLIFTLKLPDEYVGAGAAMQTQNCTITKSTRNTLELKLVLNPNENNKKYGTINASIRLKAKEYSIKVSDSNDEIIGAIQNEQNVTVDMREEIRDIQSEIFKNLANQDNVDLKVQTANAKWKFNSNDITDPNITVNPKVTIANNKFEDMNKTPFEDAIYLKFDHEGKLPGKAEIELDISNNNIYEKGKTVYLYYYDSTKNEYQYLNALTVGDKKVTITLEHCSEYVISDKLLAVDPGDSNGEETIKPDKPTQEPEANKENTPNASTPTKPRNPNKPDTGDHSNITLWVSIMIVSVLGIVFIVLHDRKKRK